MVHVERFLANGIEWKFFVLGLRSVMAMLALWLMLAVAGQASAQGSGVLGKPGLLLGEAPMIYAMAQSPDGRVLVTGGQGNAVVVWDTNSGRELRRLLGHTHTIWSLSFSPDGRRVVSGSSDGTVRIWDVERGTLSRQITARSLVYSVEFSPDGRSVAYGVYDGTVVVADVDTGAPRLELAPTKEAIDAVAFAPSGRLLVTSSRDGLVRVFDTATRRQLASASGAALSFGALAVSKDGELLAWRTADKRIAIAKFPGLQQVEYLAEGGYATGTLAFSPSGALLASATGGQNVRIWNVSRRDVALEIPASQEFYRLAWNPDGRSLSLGGSPDSAQTFSIDRKVTTVMFRSQALGRTMVALLPGGRRMIAANGTGAIYVVDIQTTETLHLLGDHPGVDQLLLNAEGSRVYSRDVAGGIKAFDVATSRLLWVLPSAGGYATMALSPRGDWLVIAGSSKQIRVVNAITGAVESRTEDDRVTFSVAVTQGGSSFVTSSDNATLRLWSLPGAKLVRTIQEGVAYTGALASAPTGEMLAVSNTRGTVSLIDTTSWRVKRTLNTASSALITALTFSPDGAVLYGGSFDNTIKRWNTDAGTELAPLTGHASPIGNVAVDSAAETLASASADGTIRLWDARSGKERVAYARLRDNHWIWLTPEGYFHRSSTLAEDALSVRVSEQLFDVTDVSALREKFHRPDVIVNVLSGRSLPANLTTLASVRLAPSVSIVNVPAQISGEDLNLQINVIERGGGVGNIRIFINGGAVVQSDSRALLPPGTSAATRSIPMRLVPGDNEIKVIAFNAEGSMSSPPVFAKVKSLAQRPGKPQLHALVVGINQFDNPKLNLKYAVPDALAVAAMLKQRAAPLFDRINVEILTTPKETTRQVLLAALTKYRNIAPDDVFVFFIASHGTVEGDDINTKEFFLIPSNMGSTSERAMRRDAISQTELKQLIANIPATKKALFLDTCHSGALGDALMVATRGMSEDAAIKVLSTAVGSTVLSASSGQQEALEGHQGHGVFTWVLLQALGGKADARNKGYVNTLDLAAYVEDEVPRVSEAIFKRKQFPTLHNAGQSFPITSSR